MLIYLIQSFHWYHFSKFFLLTFHIKILQLSLRNLETFSLGICLACLMTLTYYSTMVKNWKGDRPITNPFAELI